MGYDVKRFQGSVDEEFICAICKCVFSRPCQIVSCEHTFCLTCIKTWFAREQICPIDRKTITDFVAAPRILRSLLSRLQIKCDFEEHGCKTVVNLDLLPVHVKNCSFNPKKPVVCYKGCGALIPNYENTISGHNCLRDLRIKIESLEAKVKILESTKCQHCNLSPVPQPTNRNTPGVPLIISLPSSSSSQ